MRKHTFTAGWALLLTMITLISPASAQNSLPETDSRLKKITVFTERAMITREATVALKKGENLIRFTRLSPNLIESSVQINLEGSSDLRIGEVNVEETFLQKTEQPEVMKLQGQLDQLTSQIREIQNQVITIHSTNEYLKRVDPFPQTQKVTPADIEAHTRYLEKSLATNFERIAVFEAKLKKLNEEKGALENELNSLNPDKSRSKSVVVRLWSPAGKSDVKLSFAYLTADAGWFPLYEARADFNGAKLSFTCFASIRQSTGEDWLNADLEISTAQPFISGNPPKLTPWYLDAFTALPFRAKSAMALNETLEQPVMMEADRTDEFFVRGTKIHEETNSFSFVIPRKVDIAADGEPHRIEITSTEQPAEFSFFTVPKLVQNVFLKTSLKNPFSFPIQSGIMSVFLDGQLVGNGTVIETIIPEDQLEISLGIDQGIKIERKLQKKFTESTGVLSKETTVEYEYLIEITNGKSKKVTLELNDQFPISRNEKIRVEPSVPKGNDATVDEKGKITWKVTLAPGEKKSIPLRFKVSHPKDMLINGLM